MGGAIAVRRLERVTDVAIGRERQALFRDCRAADGTAQPFQLVALMGLGGDAGMQRIHYRTLFICGL